MATTEVLNGDSTGFIDGSWESTDSGDIWNDPASIPSRFSCRATNNTRQTDRRNHIGLTFQTAGTDPIRATAATLTLQMNGISPSIATQLRVYLYTIPEHTAWSDNFLPNSALWTHDSLGFVILAGTATVSASTADGTDVVVTLDHDVLTTLTAQNTWDERFNFELRSDNGDNFLSFKEMGVGGVTSAEAARFSWTYAPVLETGISSYRQSVSRIDFCPI